MLKISVSALAAILFVGCSTVKQGSPDAAAIARDVKPAEKTTAIYFCRDWAYAGGGVNLYPMINGEIAATLPTKSFTRIDLAPGEYEIALGYSDEHDSAFYRSLSRNPVKMEVIQGKAGEIHRYWIGMAGSSLFGGSLTIDFFDNKAQAKACIDSSIYVDPRTPFLAIK